MRLLRIQSMKRITSLVLLMLSLCSLSALSWEPSIELGAVYDGTSFSNSVDSDATLRSTVGMAIRGDVLTLSFSDHRVSLPATLTFLSSSSVEGRTKLQQRLLTELSLEYGYRITDLIALSFSADLIYEWYIDSSAGRWMLGFSTTPLIALTDILTLTVPLSIRFSKATFAFETGVGLRLGIGGLR